MSTPQPPPQLDHILWACADLEEGVRRFETLTGVRARFGGVHASGVTHNALVALGPRCYLEILAPTGPATAAEDEFSRLARSSSSPRVVTYCLRSPVTLSELAARAARAGLSNLMVTSNGRTTPDGVRLSWEWLAPKTDRFGLAFPFFIDWRESPHPAQMLAAAASTTTTTTAPAVRLRRLAVGHPEAHDLERLLVELGSPVETEPAAQPHFVVELDTPRGRVLL